MTEWTAAKIIRERRGQIELASEALIRTLGDRGIHLQNSTAIICLAEALRVWELTGGTRGEGGKRDAD